MIKAKNRTYDASQYRTLIKNKNKLPWTKVKDETLLYLESTKRLFQRTEILINPERRINGIKIDDSILQRVERLLQISYCTDKIDCKRISAGDGILIWHHFGLWGSSLQDDVVYIQINSFTSGAMCSNMTRLSLFLSQRCFITHFFQSFSLLALGE